MLRRANIGILSTVMIMVVCGFVGFCWAYRTFKRYRLGVKVTEIKQSSTLEGLDHNRLSQNERSPLQQCYGSEEQYDLENPVENSFASLKFPSNALFHQSSESHNVNIQSGNMCTPQATQDRRNYIQVPSDDDNSYNFEGNISFLCIKCEGPITCQSGHTDDIQVHYVEENDPHDRRFNSSHNKDINTNEVDIKSQHYRKNSHYNRFNGVHSNETIISTGAKSLNNSKIYNSAAKRSRRRLLSLQTSFEEESSSSCKCNSGNCVVTEVTNLGNGKVKKTVYRYDLQTSEEKI